VASSCTVTSTCIWACGAHSLKDAVSLNKCTSLCSICRHRGPNSLKDAICVAARMSANALLWGWLSVHTEAGNGQDGSA